MRLASWKSIILALTLCAVALCGIGICYRRSLLEWITSQHEAWKERQDQVAIDSQTTKLPTVDKAEIYCLGELPAKSRDGFPIRPYDENAQIVTSRLLTTSESQTLAQLWRTRHFGGGGALCHEPAYGIRFFHDRTMVLETSLCWMCANCFVKDSSGSRLWIGFSDPNDELLKALEKLLPRDSKKPLAGDSDKG